MEVNKNIFERNNKKHIKFYCITAWKKPIVLMATTGIAAGVVGEGFIVLTALLEKCTKKFFAHLCAKMIAVTSVLCACEYF